MKSYIIKKLPACEDYKGNKYPDRFGVTLKCSRGYGWDGGEYLTRDEAVSAGLAATHHNG